MISDLCSLFKSSLVFVSVYCSLIIFISTRSPFLATGLLVDHRARRAA